MSHKPIHCIISKRKMASGSIININFNEIQNQGKYFFLRKKVFVILSQQDILYIHDF